MKIIWWDIDHILMSSETRDEWAHSLEKIDGAWHCTCEDATITGNEVCKHVAAVKQFEKTAKMWKELSNASR